MDEKIKKTILYIDDEPENLIGFKYTFREDFTIFLANSAREGFKALKENNIKIIVCDQRMPEMTGVEFFEKTALEYPDIVRILLTGYTNIQDIINAINKGQIYRYLSKPWNNDELKLAIENGLKLYNLQEENKILIEELQKMNKQLEVAKNIAIDSDKLKSAFIANISHEIRTPLNAIIGLSTIVSSNSIDYEQKSEYINLIEENAHQLLSVFDEVFFLSKLESAEIAVEKSEFEITGLLSDLYENFRNSELLLKKLNVRLICKFCNLVSSEILITDRYKLHKLLYNLINNAIKYTEKGYIEYGYTIIVNEKNEKQIQFYVKDTGIGIHQNEFDKIFERFIKIEHKDSYFVGTGLGLTISKKLSEILGGTIYLTSEVDKGTTFFVQMPFPVAIGNLEQIKIYEM